MQEVEDRWQTLERIFLELLILLPQKNGEVVSREGIIGWLCDTGSPRQRKHAHSHLRTAPAA
jgi:hypothetical protein